MDMSIEEELIQLRFIEGLHDGNQRDKVLERLQSTNMALETCVEFIQQLEMISSFKEVTQDNTMVFRVEENIQENNEILQIKKRRFKKTVNTAILSTVLRTKLTVLLTGRLVSCVRKRTTLEQFAKSSRNGYLR